MKRLSLQITLAFLILANIVATGLCEILPSWNDSVAKNEIVAFVEKITSKDSPDFLPEEDRIAVFDNDGTLICEKPIYIQFAHAHHRIKELVGSNPDWKSKEPFSAVLDGRLSGAGLKHEADHKDFAKLVLAVSENQTPAETQRAAVEWLSRAENPVLKKPYSQTVFQPMRELLDYLRSNGFTTYIVSGGGAEFIRSYSQKFYGIPARQVIGSQAKMAFEERNGSYEVMLQGEPEFFTNGSGKPFAIVRNIGKRPALAFGNSDGDLEMLQWTTTGSGPRLGLLLHHDDAEREFAYDRESAVGRLDKALDEAGKRNWRVVSMKNDWKQVFP